MSDRLSRYQAWTVWDSVVGEQIARRARPLRFREGILEVRVDNAVWMQQLQMLKPKILQKLNAKLPHANIEDIFLRRGTLPQPVETAPKATAPPAWKAQQLAPEEIDQIEQSVDGIDDNELKNELKQLFSLQKKLQKTQSANDED